MFCLEPLVLTYLYRFPSGLPLLSQDPPEPEYAAVDAEDPGMHFADPAQLLAVFSQLEGSNMFLIQTTQDAEAALEAAKASAGGRKQYEQTRTFGACCLMVRPAAGTSASPTHPRTLPPTLPPLCRGGAGSSQRTGLGAGSTGSRAGGGGGSGARTLQPPACRGGGAGGGGRCKRRAAASARMEHCHWRRRSRRPAHGQQYAAH